MNDESLQTIQQIRQFLQGSATLEFGGISIEERYHWIETVLVRFKYLQLERADKGVIRRYLEKVSGYSRAQVSRLIGHYNRKGCLRKADYDRHRFPKKYTLADIALLARTDDCTTVLAGQPLKRLWNGNGPCTGIQISVTSHGYLLPISTICAAVTFTGASTNVIQKPNHQW